jgi:hypothetical protein
VPDPPARMIPLHGILSACTFEEFLSVTGII